MSDKGPNLKKPMSPSARRGYGPHILGKGGRKPYKAGWGRRAALFAKRFGG